MELREAILGRRSVRAFSPEDVSQETMKELIGLANMAPSAGNLQSRDFVVVREQEKKKGLARAALDQEFIAEAPVVVVVCSNLRRVEWYGDRGKRLYAIQDAAAAVQNLLLAAHEKGLGAVWVGAFREGEVSRVLELPDYARPVAIIPIGHPLESPAVPERIPLPEILHEERW